MVANAKNTLPLNICQYSGLLWVHAILRYTFKFKNSAIKNTLTYWLVSVSSHSFQVILDLYMTESGNVWVGEYYLCK